MHLVAFSEKTEGLVLNSQEHIYVSVANRSDRQANGQIRTPGPEAPHKLREIMHKCSLHSIQINRVKHPALPSIRHRAALYTP